MKYFFTSDTHFGHANIILYCNRPFFQPADLNAEGKWKDKTIARWRADAMDAELIRRWNSVVSKDDVVYHLGDFCFGEANDALHYLRQINFGRFYFIYGNHDSAMQDVHRLMKADPAVRRALENRVFFIGNLSEIKIGSQKISLCHYAMRTWDKSHRSAWQLYGHSHGTLPDDPHALSMDVGVDPHNLTPISFEEVQEKLSKKLFKPIDHHGEAQEGGGTGLSKADYEKAERRRLYEQLCVEFAHEPVCPKCGKSDAMVCHHTHAI